MEKPQTLKHQEKAILVGLIHASERRAEADEHLEELQLLTATAGAQTEGKFQQKIHKPNPKTLVGRGKLEEIKAFMEEHGIKLVIFDDELSPSQFKNIENFLDCKVMDRTNLILDIFSKRAKTSQAKTQVELAQYQYILPRLTRMWTHHSRQQGGIGTKGPGEKEIETDRRIIHKKIKQLEEKLEKIDQQNETQRKNRGQKVRVALVGYTNSGKSTLMNHLSDAKIPAENQLFATLDTTVRKVVLDQVPFLLSDTVGFIRKLPHKLVESFKSTLDEAREADILLHVVDITHPNFEHQMTVVNETLLEMDSDDKPVITIFNKIDQYLDQAVNGERQERMNELQRLEKSWMAKKHDQVLFISALNGDNLEQFKTALLDQVIATYRESYPYQPIRVDQ